MANALHFIFGINMEIKYSYFVPLTEETLTLEREELLDYVESFLECNEDGELSHEDIKDIIITIALEDLDGLGINSDTLEFVISDEVVNAVMSEIENAQGSQNQAVENIRKILDEFDPQTQQRILDMI